MKNIIINYINKISKKDVFDFATKNDIFLSKDELNIIYNIIKNNYQDILSNKDENIVKYLKENLSNTNYQKTINLYQTYKQKYQNYL